MQDLGTFLLFGPSRRAHMSDCVVCSGRRGRGRNGDNGTRCKHQRCKEELTARNKAERAARLESSAGDAAPPADTDPTACFKIKEVLGVSMCLKMTKKERRLGRAADVEADIYYHLRGKYGGGADEDEDDMVSDTRWEPLNDLVSHLSEPQLAVLDAWAGSLQKKAKAARKELRKRQREEDA